MTYLSFDDTLHHLAYPMNILFLSTWWFGTWRLERTTYLLIDDCRLFFHSSLLLVHFFFHFSNQITFLIMTIGRGFGLHVLCTYINCTVSIEGVSSSYRRLSRRLFF